MRTLRWSLTGLFACGLPTACADPCLDDGLGQAECPSQGTVSDTEGSTNGSSPTASATLGSATGSTLTNGMSGQADGSGTNSTSDSDSDSTTTMGVVTDTDSATAGSDTGTGTGTDTDTESDSDGPGLWCVDADDDGFGDPDDCQESDEPIDGSVDNGDDCNDGDDDTFPGAAPNDDPFACMQDEDGDDWGDLEPPPGVEAGTDCRDDDPAIFPGAAANEPREGLCTIDADGDGFGDAFPPDGVTPGTDCLDDNMGVFPGAADNEMPPDLCAEDEDGDGWGDTNPPPGAEAGNDCDDMDAFTFPGAAENEMPPGQCMTDTDGDGWGDTNPDGAGMEGGPVPGSDCYDANTDLNPDTLQLTATLPYIADAAVPRTIAIVDPSTDPIGLNEAVTLTSPGGAPPDLRLVSTTINEAGQIYTNDVLSVQLYTIGDGEAACLGVTADVLPVGMPDTSYGEPGDIVCGLEFGGDGTLYGVNTDDEVVTFDAATGQITDAFPIEFMGVPLNISSCGMARECATDRLLVANGINRSIYSVDPTNGQAELVRDLSGFLAGEWLPAGMEYDPVQQRLLVSTGSSLVTVDLLDALSPPIVVGSYPVGNTVSNLQYLPVCME